MTQHTGGTIDQSKDGIYRCLSHHRRRRILAILTETRGSISVDALASRLAARTGDDETDAESDHAALTVDLEHAQLPALADAEFVYWDRDSGTVTPTIRSTWAVRRGWTTPERLDPSWDALLKALADGRRRLVLSVTARHGDPIAVDTLARVIAHRERDADCRSRDVRTTLHHRDLPTLEDAGLLAVDAEAGTVQFQGHPSLEDDWFVLERSNSGQDGSIPVPANGI